ncbi:short chain dehydrogenase family protein [Mycobacterium xenopi 4042]|uniref:Short chain dehydrogenase family protein n=1 Tax=Mycobacterium xenopi 4042 TaxID=1299334 RepID=X8AFV3_MYCXE|nr:short chain dehydrogenase family protein [Mycobacterium xenopi 4042]
MDSFDGRGAVITGGASGIGLAMARELARRGARIVLGDMEEPALEQAVARLRGEGLDAHGVVCDVRRLDEVDHLADEAFRPCAVCMRCATMPGSRWPGRSCRWRTTTGDG